MRGRGEVITVSIADPGVKELLPTYLARRAAEVERVRKALAEKDFEGIRAVGHNLHGSGAAYGLERLSELGAELEDAASAADEVAVGQILDALVRFLARLRIV